MLSLRWPFDDRHDLPGRCDPFDSDEGIGERVCRGWRRDDASVAARLGGVVHYWGRVGDNALGKRIVALLESEGVQTTAMRRIEGAQSPCTAVLVDDCGESTQSSLSPV